MRSFLGFLVPTEEKDPRLPFWVILVSLSGDHRWCPV